MFIDTHCHLDDPLFEGRLAKVLEGAALQGVTRYVVPGVDASSWRRMAMLASFPRVFLAFGLHPLAADSFSGIRRELEDYVEGGIAIGEIGLDYLLEVDREAQKEAFRAQLLLARRHRLPVLIHCRKAFVDLLRIVDEEGISGGVMHAFSGSCEIARECMARGLYISVAGPVTYENAVRPRDVVKSVPLERLVLETDAPDLTPHPHRRRPNEPSLLPLIAAEVARIKGVPIDEVARVTTENAARMLGIDAQDT